MVSGMPSISVCLLRREESYALLHSFISKTSASHPKCHQYIPEALLTTVVLRRFCPIPTMFHDRTGTEIPDVPAFVLESSIAAMQGRKNSFLKS
jgi:hypothetical protein